MKREIKWLLRQGVGMAGKVAAAAFGRAVVATTGYVYDVPRSMQGLMYASLTLGRYEKAEIKILRDHFRKASNIIEIGANIGIVTRVAISEKLDDDGMYVAVEPNPRSLEVLDRNIKRSAPLSGNKEAFIENAALAGPDKDNTFATFMMRPNLSSGLASHTASQVKEEAVNVPLISLGRILKIYDMDRASLVIDAEGAEIDMILKDAEALKRIDQMAIEVHETSLTGRNDYPPAKVVDELRKQGFTVGGRAENTYYLYRPEAYSL